MNKIVTAILLGWILLFASVGAVFAYDLKLTKIGTLSTVGVDYTLVDYVGGIPVLEGTATPGAQVSIKIKTVVGYSAAASPSGIWQFIPTSMDTGTNPITISSGAQNISFTLNFNSIASPTPTATPAATTTPTPTPEPVTALPATGIWENMAVVLVVGIGVMFFGGTVRRKMAAWEGKK